LLYDINPHCCRGKSRQARWCRLAHMTVGFSTGNLEACQNFEQGGPCRLFSRVLFLLQLQFVLYLPVFHTDNI
jgi:hypothetical protein